MARRSDHTRPQLHEMLLAAGEEILREQGAQALTARALAQRIGYSVGTVYNLFDNLDDLILQINGRTLDALYQALTASPPERTPEAAVRALARAYVRFTAENRALWTALFEYSLADKDHMTDAYLAKIDRVFGLVEAALAPLFPDQPEERRKAARVLWSSLHGICSLSLTGKLDLVGAQPVTEMADSLVDNYLAGLRLARQTV